LFASVSMSHVALVVLAFLAPQFDCLRVSSPSLRPSRSVFRAAAPRLSAPIEDADDLPKNDAGLPSDEDLMASFKNRLDQEGGATQFRLRTDAQRAIEPLKEGAEGLKEKNQQHQHSNAGSRAAQEQQRPARRGSVEDAGRLLWRGHPPLRGDGDQHQYAGR